MESTYNMTGKKNGTRDDRKQTKRQKDRLTKQTMDVP